MTDVQVIIDSIRADECVLVLGPRAATFEGEYLTDLLSDRIAQQLGLPADTPRDLQRLALEYAAKFNNPTEGLAQTGALLTSFYGEFKDEYIPVYDMAARLPFKYVLNCTPDKLFAEALGRYDKEGLFYSFHFRKPIFNTHENDRALNLDKEISEDAPLIYNLLGHLGDPSSLVLTDKDRLAFLDVVLQREKESTLPANVTFHFLRPPVNRLRKTYLFLGFNFSEWHMRLFMHLMHRTHEHLPQSLSLQNKEQLDAETAVFYSSNFDMLFLPDDPAALLGEVYRKMETPAPAPVPARMELMMLYHPADKALHDELVTYLSTLRNSGLVECWHEDCIQPGDEREAEMQEHLHNARIILPLITANFLADEHLYGNYLTTALRRDADGIAKLIPLLLTPCDVVNTPLFKLNTLYPKPKGRAVSQKPDRAEALTSFAQELRSTVERMLKITNSAQP